jgi:hypothetical protein
MCAAREQLREARAAMSATEAPRTASEAPVRRSGGSLLTGVKAVLLAGVAALIGAFLWSRIALWTGWSFGLLAVALGWGIGVAIRVSAAPQPGVFLRWLALLLTALGVMLGFGLIQMGQTYRLYPELAQEAAGVPLPLQVLLFTAAAPTKLGLLDWLFAYLAIFAAWRATRGRDAHSRRDRMMTGSEGDAEMRPLVTAGSVSVQDTQNEPSPFSSAPPPMGLPREGEERR